MAYTTNNITNLKLIKWQQHCNKNKKCYKCGKSSDCFDLFGLYKPRDFIIQNEKLVKIK